MSSALGPSEKRLFEAKKNGSFQNAIDLKVIVKVKENLFPFV